MTMTKDTREALADAAAEFTKLTGCEWEVRDDWLQHGPGVFDKKHRQYVRLKSIKNALTGNVTEAISTDGSRFADFSAEPIGIVAMHKWGVEHL